MNTRITLALVLGLFLSTPALAQLEAMEDDTPPDLKEKSSAVSRPAPAPAKSVAAVPAAGAKPAPAQASSSAPATANSPAAVSSPVPAQSKSVAAVPTAVSKPSSATGKPTAVPAPAATPVKIAATPGAISGQIMSGPGKSGLPPTHRCGSTQIRPFRPLAASSGAHYSRIPAGTARASRGGGHYVKPIHVSPGQATVCAGAQKSAKNVLARHATSGKRYIAQAQAVHRQPSVLSYSSHQGVVWTNNNASSYKTYH